MAFEFSIPSPTSSTELSLAEGSSLIFVGANGGGKTRLAVRLEELVDDKAHRISAHRALTLNPGVPKIKEEDAIRGIRFGQPGHQFDVRHRPGQRWGQNAATHLLSDFDFLVQALFAEQSKRALETHKTVRRGDEIIAAPTKFEILEGIWDRLLPHRRLHISGDDILVSVSGSQETYSAAEMSDGERAIFYIIGQVLVAQSASLFIVDEPELHVHRSILGKLWDELEAARPDCAFVFITHDLEFAAGRAAAKYVIREYTPATGWVIDEVSPAEGFDDELAALILGSRRPILFVEGGERSLDIAVYRCAYPEWTVIPRGSCEAVIHSVVSTRASGSLTRIACAGIVDADGRSDADVALLNGMQVYVLPVSEIENLFLLPVVSEAILAHEAYGEEKRRMCLAALRDAVFQRIEGDAAKETIAVRNARRLIDRELKRLSFQSASTTDELVDAYRTGMAVLDVAAIVEGIKASIEAAEAEKNLPELLKLYDNKGLLADASSHLKSTGRNAFEAWLTRALRNDSAPELVDAVGAALPQIPAPE